MQSPLTLDALWHGWFKPCANLPLTVAGKLGIKTHPNIVVPTSLEKQGGAGAAAGACELFADGNATVSNERRVVSWSWLSDYL